MSDKLNIANEMRAFDSKERNFYDDLTPEERKKFSTYLMLKWGANVEGSPELQEWYLRVHNDRVNINFFDLGRHPKLQWLLCTTVSPGLGAKRHYWINKKGGSTNKAHKFIAQQYPHLRDDEIELLLTTVSKDDLKQFALELGWDDKQIKSDL